MLNPKLIAYAEHVRETMTRAGYPDHREPPSDIIKAVRWTLMAKAHVRIRRAFLAVALDDQLHRRASEIAIMRAGRNLWSSRF
jgi:hypothetical protein